jgi:LacI family transcriptional regulator
MPRTTITDVAARARVSSATVSRVLNGVATVKSEHRERVLKAARDLGYHPNGVARNLRRRQTEMIAVLISDVENPHFAEMVRAVEDAAYRSRRRVVLCNSDENADKQRDYIEIIARERVQGAIIVANDPAGPELSDLLDLGISLVGFDRPLRDERADSVLVDNRAGAGLATRHLLDAGHERIGFVTGPPTVYTATERAAGYEGAMAAAGAEAIVEHGDFRVDGGRAATARLLERRPDITGLIVANNLMSLGALHALRVAGASPAMVGFDDPLWASMIDPALTVLAQPVREMSQRAVELLLERIAGERTEPRHEVFDLELRVRDSCRTNAPGTWKD